MNSLFAIEEIAVGNSASSLQRSALLKKFLLAINGHVEQEIYSQDLNVLVRAWNFPDGLADSSCNPPLDGEWIRSDFLDKNCDVDFPLLVLSSRTTFLPVQENNFQTVFFAYAGHEMISDVT